MDNRNTRWSLEATIDPSDKVRLRGFVRNEIAYYNALLGTFSSRLRTMPDLLSEVDEDLLGEVAAHGYNVRAFTPESLPANLKRFKNTLFSEDGKPVLGDRALLLLDGVTVGSVLHPEVRRAMAVEILRHHVRAAEGLRRETRRDDQVLSAPVELLHPIEARTKRHVQLPKSAVFFNEEGTSFRTAYNGVPIQVHPALPKEFSWNVLILRDQDRPDQPRAWTAEFRNERANYLIRQSDPPLQKIKKARRAEPAR